jgi:hypothetical protein
MPKKPIKNRLIPYKVLVLLLYGQYTWLVRNPSDGSIMLRLGPMSRFLRVSSSRLREQLDWLFLNRYFASLSVKYGEAVVTIRSPLVSPSAKGEPSTPSDE